MRAATVFVTAALAGAALATDVPQALAAPLEEPVTLSATSITTTAATLNGTLNPNAKADLGWYFAYAVGTTCAGGATTPPQAPAEVQALHVSARVTGLIPHTRYAVCLVATGSAGASFSGTPKTFLTRRQPPEIAGQAASEIGERTARVEALIDPELQPTTCVGVQYIPAAAFEATGWVGAGEAGCNEASLGAGEEPVPIHAQLAELTTATTYHYRFVAENGSGSGFGEDSTFTTPPPFPSATTGAASLAAPGAATLSGSIDPNGTVAASETSVFFEYGPTPAYGNSTEPRDAGSGTSPLPVSAMVEHLAGGTTYHYRVVASNDAGGPPQVTFGEDMTFRTPAIPPALGAPSVTAISPTAAQILATIEPAGAPAHYELKVGPSAAWLASLAQGSTAEATTLSFPLEGLAPGTTYLYRLLAVGADAPEEVAAREGTFSTPAAGGGSPGLLSWPPVPPQLAVPQIAFPAEEPAGSVLGTRSTRPANAKKLARALRACHRKHGARRRACERSAHRRYP